MPKVLLLHSSPNLLEELIWLKTREDKRHDKVLQFI